MDRFNAIPVKIPKEIEKLTLKCMGGVEFPGGPVTKTQHSLDLIPNLETISHMQQLKSLHATAEKNPTCCQEDQRGYVPQIRPGAAKLKKNVQGSANTIMIKI